MNKLLFVLLLLPLLSKSQDKVLFIELENEKFEIANRDFYISKVIDEREDKAITWTIQKRGVNHKHNAQFKDGSEVAIFNFISNSLPKEEGQKEILIKIIDLQLSEITLSGLKICKAILKMDFYSYDDSGHFVKVYQTGSDKKERSSIGAARHHETRIREGIKHCLEKLGSSLKENLDLEFSENKEMEVSLPDNLVAGVYKNFEEFLANKPSITKEYYVNSKPRTHKKWNETSSFFPPRDSNSNRKIKEIWGFSDGESAYILHQNEYFPIELEENTYRFVGFDKIDQAPLIATIIFGGLILVGLSSAANHKIAKNRPTEYFIDTFTGMPINVEEEKVKSLGKMVKLCFYRMGKNEVNAPLKFSVNDSLKYDFVPNSFSVLNFRLKESPIKVCYGPNLDLCIEVELNEEEDTYVKCAFLSTEEIPLVHKVKTTKGEFEVFTPKKVQKKRDKQKLKNTYSD